MNKCVISPGDGSAAGKTKMPPSRPERHTVAPLSIEAERELGWAIVNDNCHESREKMILANLHLVSDVACRYSGRGVSLGELIERGKAGLIRAVEHYDPAQGMRFSTPARWWIKQAIRQAMHSLASAPKACRRIDELAAVADHPETSRDRMNSGSLRSESVAVRVPGRGARPVSPTL